MPETNNTNTRTAGLTAMYIDALNRLQANQMSYTVALNDIIDPELATSRSTTENTVADPMDELVTQMERRQNERKFDHAFTID